MSFPINEGTKEVLRLHGKLAGHSCYIIDRLMVQLYDI